MIEIKKFNDYGLNEFRKLLLEIKDKPVLEINKLDEECFEKLPIKNLFIDETKIFASKYAMAEYLSQIFENAGAQNRDIMSQNNMWSWMCYIWINQFCPMKNGKRVVFAISKYICSTEYNTYYRHFIASAYTIYSVHGPEYSKLMLNTPLEKYGDIIEQVASRQDIISQKELIKTIQSLYYDPAQNKQKTGATSKNKNGNIRRLIKLFQQLERIFDIYSMESKMIIDLLPGEFNRWK